MCRIRSYVRVFLFIKLGGEVALKLNARQKAFCEFYVASGNATDAAIKAGYSYNYANAQIYKMLGNVGIKNYIDELMKKSQNERIATAEEVLNYLTSVMKGEGQEEVVANTGNVVYKSPSIKDRIKAAELLGKRYALWTDKTKIEGTLPVMIVGEDDLDE
nr:MAG TPA: Terminase small subunit [Caudoviricetes sp.]